MIEFEKYIEETIRVQKLNFVLTFKRKKPAFSAKTPKKTKRDNVRHFQYDSVR